MSYDLMFKKAIERQNDGALNEAEDIYLKILQAMPENSDAWNMLGLVAQGKGAWLKAADCFLAAIKYAPMPFAPHFFNLGLSYKALGKQSEALEAFERAARLAPDMKEAWNYLGLVQAQSGDNAAAAKSFCRALDADEDYTEARANLCFYTKDSEALFKLADEEESSFAANSLAAEASNDAIQKEKYLRRAVTAAPYHCSGLTALAAFLSARGDFSEALTLYHKALNLDENNIEALLGAADAYLAQNVLDKAETYYNKSFSLRRDIAGAHLNYGILLYRQKRLAEALDEYRAAAALEPEVPEISYNLALILKETGDYEEALGLMFNAHLKRPENEVFAINIMETLGELFTNNAELALKIAENWQKLEPDNIFSRRLAAGLGGMAAEEDNSQFAEKLFDNFADSYETAMARLNPQIINKFKELRPDIKGRILDLGCGTGLAADTLKTENNHFDGVDISAKMLDIARTKGKYDTLYQADIAAWLEKNPPARQYDLALAFDVFCYFGDLAGVLAALKGVEIWFSAESADDECGKNYYPAPNGRYKHRRQYVEKALKAAGFKEIEATPLVLRQENGTDVPGFLFRAK